VEEKMTLLGLNKFLDRQRDPNGGLTHWEFSDEELLRRIEAGWEKRRPGYREGVVLVPVPAKGFRAGLRVLQEGDELKGSYKARQAGETPRKALAYVSPVPVAEAKTEPLSVDVVLYHRDVLAEGGDIVTTEWSAIAVLGKFCPEGVEEPMTPDTLMANHFQDSGGTATGMSPEEFQEALRRSYFYWRDKAFLG
jgi:hypothetical protein